jgi:hypothetical protein
MPPRTPPDIPVALCQAIPRIACAGVVFLAGGDNSLGGPGGEVKGYGRRPADSWSCGWSWRWLSVFADAKWRCGEAWHLLLAAGFAGRLG